MTAIPDPAPANPFPAPLGPELDLIVARYPRRAAAMLPVLTRLQRERGHLDDGTLEQVAAYLGVSLAHVHGVVGFYSMYDRSPVGRHKVYVCKTISCRLRGSEEVLKALEERLGVKRGGTTPDGKFTLVPFECLGLCDIAPAALVGEKRYGPLDAAGVKGMLEDLQ